MDPMEGNIDLSRYDEQPGKIRPESAVGRTVRSVVVQPSERSKSGGELQDQQVAQSTGPVTVIIAISVSALCANQIVLLRCFTAKVRRRTPAGHIDAVILSQ
eukprot:5622975-Amphidinium_carterae.1